MTFQRIIVPVDYSPNSRRALALALGIAGPNGVDAVHVWDRPSYVSGDVTVGHADGSRRSLADLILENAEREMTDFLSTVEVPPGAQLRHRLVPGEPVAAVLDQIAQHNYDLLVIGTHGRSGVTRMLLGSMTDKLIRMSPIPVLTVPPARD